MQFQLPQDIKIPRVLDLVLLSAGFLVLSTEVLSVGHLITPNSIRLLWLPVAVIAPFLLVTHVRKNHSHCLHLQHQREVSTMLTIAVIGTILAVTLLTALLSAPTNFDSMTYHLPRVEHWIQNRSLAFYPTRSERQLFSAPLAEVIILNLQLLAGTARLANLVQWFAFLGSILSAWQIARALNGDRLTAAFSALLTATIPMAVLQSTGTQNDLVVAFFLSATASCFLTWQGNKKSLFNAALFGLSAGLSLYSKGTGYFFVLPFAMAFAVLCIRDSGYSAPKLFIAAAVPCTLIMLPFMLRVYNRFGNPLYSGAIPISPTEFHVSSMLAQFIYHLASHVNYPIGQIGSASTAVASFLAAIVLGDHTVQTFNNHPFEVPALWHFEPDLIGNPVHVVLIIFALCSCLMPNHAQKTPKFNLYVVLVVAGIFLEAVFLRWQPWISRLTLAGFILMSPVVAVSIFSSRQSKLIVGGILFVMASGAALVNVERPLLGYPGRSVLFQSTTNQMFMKQPDSYRDSVMQMIDEVSARKPSKFGLIAGGNDWEYPYWFLLRSKMSELPEIRAACLNTLEHPDDEESNPEWVPDLILAQLNSAGQAEQDMRCSKENFTLVKEVKGRSAGGDMTLALYQRTYIPAGPVKSSN